jgi:hypothetical protein
MPSRAAHDGSSGVVSNLKIGKFPWPRRPSNPSKQRLRALGFCREMVDTLEVVEDLALFNCTLNDQLIHAIPRADALLLADGEDLYPDPPRLLLKEGLETMLLELGDRHPQHLRRRLQHNRHRPRLPLHPYMMEIRRFLSTSSLTASNAVIVFSPTRLPSGPTLYRLHADPGRSHV